MRTVLLFSPWLLVREGWQAVLDEQADWLPTGNSGDIAGAVLLIRTTPPDLILADIEFTTRNGFDLLATLRHASRISSVVCISSQFPSAALPRLRRLGVRGCISKNVSLHTFLKVISIVANGGSHYPPPADNSQNQPVADCRSLTKRELEVAGCIASGRSTRDIAAELGLSPKTVALHRFNILKKLKLKNTVCLVNLMMDPATARENSLTIW